jgi:hypothetical protein
MQRRVGVLLGFLIVFIASQVVAQDKICPLLNSAEVGSIGATGQGIEGGMPIPNGPTKGETMKMCSWRMSNGGMHLSVARMPPGMALTTVMAQLNGVYTQLKSQGWKEEDGDFGNVKCTLFTPPAGKPDDPMTTSCFALAKGMMMSISTLSKTRIPMDKVKALVDSAAGRL